MVPALRHRLLLATLAVLAAQAFAQPITPRPDPLDPTARVPATSYESSLQPPGMGAEDKPMGWREANDAVTRIGGWRVYAREAQQPDPAPPAMPGAAPMTTPATTPAAGSRPGHAGHGARKP